MFDKVTIAYRGARYEIGRARDCYGIWTAGGSRSQPLQWWPETSEGWSAAWTRFTEVEAPGTIVPVGRRTPAVPQVPAQGAASAAASAPQVPAYVAGSVVREGENTGSAVDPGWRSETAGPPYGPAETGPMAGIRTAGAVVAASLLGLGVLLGIAGLFPDYLGGASLAQSNSDLVPHVIYLAAWTASALLILSGGTRLRLGALLGAGLSVVTFGLFLADAGTAMADGAHVAGWGLWLAQLGWLGCAAGSVLAFGIRPASAPAAYRQPEARGRFSLRRPHGAEIGVAMMLVLAGLGVAAAFAPSWDSYLLKTTAGQSQSYIAGNAFSNPGPVIAGDVLVMVALAAVVTLAALWRPARHGAVLLAGAAIPMVAQAVSALIQVAQPASPAQFGISSAQAKQLGLTISSGVTPAFWVYCGFLVALIVLCAWMFVTPHWALGSPQAAPGSAPRSPSRDGGYTTWNPAAPDTAETAGASSAVSAGRYATGSDTRPATS